MRKADFGAVDRAIAGAFDDRKEGRKVRVQDKSIEAFLCGLSTCTLIPVR